MQQEAILTGFGFRCIAGGECKMEKIYEIKAHILKFYSKYSRYIDWGFRFLLAVLTFTFVNNNVGFMSAVSSPFVTIGLSVLCSFLPITITSICAATLVLLHFFTLTAGAALVAGLILLFMFAMYFRFAPGKSVILLLTPIAFYMEVPVIIPIVFGLIGGPVCVIPIAFGTIVYYMISYVKSYAAVIETVAGTGAMAQITNFTQQLFNNKEMWLYIVSFTVCLILVYNLRKLSVDRAWEIAVVAGVLINILFMTFGHIMLNVEIAYASVIVGSIVAAIVALIVEIFVFSVDYSRTEYLQFEDDEYCYYVKAVPKISVALSEKTVKKINVRQEKNDTQDLKKEDDIKKGNTINKEENKAAEAGKAQKENQQFSESMEDKEERRRKYEMEESEIQKIIEEELKN